MLVALFSCKKEEIGAEQANTKVSGKVVRFGTNAPAIAGPIRIQVFEQEEASSPPLLPTNKLLKEVSTDAQGQYSFEITASRNPRFRYFAQLATPVDMHFDPADFPFYFDAGRTQTLSLFHYPKAWLKMRARLLSGGVGHHLNITFPNGADYDHWGTAEFETLELLVGNATQRVQVVLTQQDSVNVVPIPLTFFKYLPAFDTTEHVLEY